MCFTTEQSNDRTTDEPARGKGVRRKWPLVLLVVAAMAAPELHAQQEPPAADSLQVQIESLRAQLDSLRALVLELQRRGADAEAEAAAEVEEDALARLRAAAREAAGRGTARDTATGGGAREEAFVGRQRSLQALNPEISVNADVFARLDPDDADSENFIPREFEISFQAALDPFSRAKIFVAHEEEGGGISPFGEEGGGHGGGEEGGEGGIVVVEEGYIEWVNLPGGFSAKAGKFFQQFGTLNRWHDHALPFQTRSLPHLAFIGEESLSQAGLSVHWLAPIQGFGTWELTGEVTRSGNEALFGESTRPSYLGHVNAFFQLSESTSLDLKGSGVFGRHQEEGVELDQRLLGAEFALNWLPPARARYREVLVRGGVMALNPDAPAAGASELDGSALGFWSMAEVRLSQRWLLGGRFDWVENPTDTDETAWLISPTLTWWQSEWVRLRAEYDILDRGSETEEQLMIQITFALGPHKHETY